MRGVPGVDAVRRGPVGLDPSVRGLRETEVGVYIDGTRMFPGGPARMDSPLSHLDPSTIRTMEIVKGPYALTWGAGNLTAIRVRTQDLPPARQGIVHGTLTTGYTGNSDEAEGLGSVYGTAGGVSYLASGAWRRGYDYTSGDGSMVPADFRSSEGRGKLGYSLPDGSYLTLSGGYQDQRGVDNPGNLLNAKFFHTYTAAAEWKRERASGTARSVDVVAYTNHVSHHMTNDGKPTAYPDSTRMPPFPLDVGVAAKVRVSGGRLDLGLAPHGAWSFEVGGDVYAANRDATRTIRRRDTGMLMFTDLMWPDATITDGGIFARASRAIGDRFSFAATGRLDLVRAHADTASDFFLDNTSAKLTSTETNVSGAATLRAELSDHWTSTLGIGSAVRTADATERYSDRVPASKAQTSAEFMGDPGLAPERNTQLDLWIETHYPRFSLEVNPFVRWVNNYITLEPTDLPKRLPLSPATVYRYVNGDARYWGAEASLGYTLASPLLARLGVTYLWGENRSLAEPSLGVAPLEGTIGLRFEPASGRGYLDGSVHLVNDQDRVATLLGETSTDGYMTADLRAGLNILPGVELRAGMLNIGDVQYVDHLNHKNPYNGMVIPEAGRELFANITYAF
jgi:iron complex outermembrane receptor protein